MLTPPNDTENIPEVFLFKANILCSRPYNEVYDAYDFGFRISSNFKFSIFNFKFRIPIFQNRREPTKREWAPGRSMPATARLVGNVYRISDFRTAAPQHSTTPGLHHPAQFRARPINSFNSINPIN